MKECKYCSEEQENWTDKFEGVIHYRELKPDYEKDRKFYHRGTHIYKTNGKAILDVENYRYIIKYCPMCGRKLSDD